MALPAALQNLSLPVIGSPMFIASGPALVAAQCKAGIVGSFPALNARPAELLDTWLTDLKKELSDYQGANPGLRIGPIAVNQIVHQSNDRLAHDVEMCVKHQVPIIISSLRAPPPEMLDAIQEALEPLGLALVLLTLDSDSFPLSVVAEEQAEEVRRLAQELGFTLTVY